MRKTILAFGALLLLVSCGEQDLQKSKAPGPKSKAALEASPKAAPSDLAQAESVARRFLLAMFENNAAEVKRLALPDADLAVLWHGDSLDRNRLEQLREHVAEMGMRKVTSGEAVRLADGQIRAVAAPLVGPGRLLLAIEDRRSSLVFPLVQVDGRWRVDASSFIAARRAAKAPRP